MSSTSVAHVVDQSEGFRRWERHEERERSADSKRSPRPGASDQSGSVGPGGIEPLYRTAADRLEQIVGADVNAPPAVIEDACAVAWTRLVLHAAHVQRDAAFGWLVATAMHEAWRIGRREARELSLEAVVDQLGDAELLPLVPGADEVFAQHERIGLVADLPPKQRRILGLHALGLSYVEMAKASGYTKRTVEREMIRARRGVRALSAA